MAAFSGGKLSDVFGKVAIVNKLPLLLKATSDDDKPTPGYLHREISALTYEGSTSQYQAAILSFLLERLQKKSWHVKLKALQVMKFVAINGEENFRNGLRRQANGIQEATKYSATPDPLHGNAPILAVRKAAVELLESLFNECLPEDIISSSPQRFSSKMEGFGRTHSDTLHKSMAGTIKDNFQQLSDAITMPVSSQDSSYKSLQGAITCNSGGKGLYTEDNLTSVGNFENSANNYQPVDLDNGEVSLPPTSITGQPQWSFLKPDSGDRTDLEGVIPGDRGLTVRTSSSSGGQSGDSFDLNQKLETVGVADWSQEVQLTSDLLSGSHARMVPSREEINTFVKRASTLNCEKIIEILVTKTRLSEETQVRCLCGIEAILREGLVTAECALPIMQGILPNLRQSSNRTVQAKASKIQRQIQQSDNLVNDSAALNSPLIPENSNLTGVNMTTINIMEDSPSKSTLFSGMSVKSGKQLPNKEDSVETNHSPEVEHDRFSISTEVWNGKKNQDLVSFGGDQQEKEMQLLGSETKLQKGVEMNSIRTEMLLMDGIEIEKEMVTDVGRNSGEEDVVVEKESEGKKCIDPLLSRNTHLSDILESLNLGQNVNLVSPKPDNELTSKESKLSANSPGHRKTAETNLYVSSQMEGSQVGHLYPQLVGAQLSSQSTVPLQLGRGCNEPFSFISASSEDKNKDAFNFVQEAMKDSKR